MAVPMPQLEVSTRTTDVTSLLNVSQCASMRGMPVQECLGDALEQAASTDGRAGLPSGAGGAEPNDPSPTVPKHSPSSRHQTLFDHSHCSKEQR
jgi:hypothetical protein